jgi:hypothetical protein
MREGWWLPYFPYESNNKIVSIVEKELKPEITQENQNYKKNYGVKPVGDPSIAGVFEDVNGDEKDDIIVRMNEIDTTPEGENPLLPFCDESGCDYYLLLNKGNNEWHKQLLGRVACIGWSKPDRNGARQLYTPQATFAWDGTAYKKVPYKPNWMIKDPVKAAPERASSVIWLDFGLPPHYDKERKEIMEITGKKYPDELKKWSKIRNFNFDAMAVADLDGNGKPDVAFVVLQVTEFDDGFINAILARYEKRKGEWILSGNETSTGDIYYFRNKKGELRLVIDGCVMEDPLDHYFGPYKSTTRDGTWLPDFLSGRREKITTIVNEELKREIEIENGVYRESNHGESPPDALIFAAFEDVNGDGKPDIIARMNGFKVGPGFHPDFPFCDNDKCDYYLLLNKGHNRWQKELLGRTACVGLSKTDKNGAMQLYTDQATFTWDGAAYKKAPYKPNWMIKEPIKPEEGLQ